MLIAAAKSLSNCGLVASLFALAFTSQLTAQHPRNYIDSDNLSCSNNVPYVNVPGWRGQPYQSCPVGGCQCGKHSKLTYYNFSTHWASPWSVLFDYGPSGDKSRPRASTVYPRHRDKIEVFAGIRLLPDVRKDNGYCGPCCDPWGYLGESRRGIAVGQSATPEEGLPINR